MRVALFALPFALAGAALLLGPAPALAQTGAGYFASHDWTGRVQKQKVKPACVYKGVMSDAEIEACTGHLVLYDYGIAPLQSAVPKS